MASASAPKEWEFATRIANKSRQASGFQMSENETRSADEILEKMVKDINANVQGGKHRTTTMPDEDEQNTGTNQEGAVAT